MNTTLILTGVILVAVSVPMIFGLVPRNPLYGFRTPTTLRSDEVWYPANRFAGGALACAGVVWLFAAALFAGPTALTIGTVSLVLAFAASFVNLSRL